MRAEWDQRPWHSRISVSLWLVIVNAAFYAAQLIVPLAGGTAGNPPPRLETHLALYPGDLLRGHVWQLLTFQFLHAGPLHLLINCAMLYIFGRSVENAIGRASFLKLYFGSGAVGGLFQAAFSWVFPAHFGWHPLAGWQPVVGASAGVFGLIAAFATLHRDTPITMLLAFIIPVTLRARYLLLVELIIALLGMLDSSSNIAHAAHLGGMLAGIFYIRNVANWHWSWRAGQRPLRRSQPRRLVNVRALKNGIWTPGETPPDEELSAEEFLAKEVDPILDKISAHGIQSLTARERKVLETARKKMQKR